MKIKLESLSLTLKNYAKRGLPIYQVVKLVDGYAVPFVELTTADFRGKVGKRVESSGWSGPGYVVQGCEPVAVSL
jgi:hypothetical protein